MYKIPQKMISLGFTALAYLILAPHLDLLDRCPDAFNGWTRTSELIVLKVESKYHIRNSYLWGSPTGIILGTT